MAKRPLPPIEFLRDCFEYDPNTGSLLWRHRPAHHFFNRNSETSWNGLNAGREAGGAGDFHRIVRVTYEGAQLRLSAHQIAYALQTGSSDVPEIDHENGDGFDNRWSNLRIASRSQNNANRKGWAKSGLPKGVTAANGKFVASASAGRGKTAYLGRFSTPAEAHAAYCAYAASRHGEFFNPGPAKPSVFD